MARSFSQEARSDSQKIGEMRYRMSHLPSTTAIARTLLLAGILLAVAVLAARSFFPAFAQEAAERIPYDENGTGSVANFTSMDPEGEVVVWVLTGDDSQDDNSDDIFSIDEGVLKFIKSPDYENPLDTNDDSIYELMITARDGPESDTDANSTSTMVVVVVNNMEEAGSIRLSTLQPKVGFEVEATLTDPDGNAAATLPITGADLDIAPEAPTAWQWARSMSVDGPWTDIAASSTAGITSDEDGYTPMDDDVGHYLRVTVSYFDGHSTGDPAEDDPDKIVRAVSANMVLDEDYTNTAPMFPDQDPDQVGPQTDQTRSVAENSTAGTRIGAPVTATDIGADNRQQVLVYSISGADSTPFQIEEGTGQIKVKAGAELDFEAPDDTGGDNMYVVTVTATDPSGLLGTAQVTIEVTDVNENPSIAQGNGQAVEITVNENRLTTDVLSPTFTATDPEDDNDELTWSLSGRDSGDFEMATTSNNNTSAQLVLNFKEPPDYENPANFARNNVYEVTLNVRDTNGLTDSQAVTVTVRPVPEGHTLTLSPERPSFGGTVTANFDSLDNLQSGSRVTYSWATSSDPIAGQTSNTYRPVEGDIGETVTVTVTYQDGHLNLGGEVTDTEESLEILARGVNGAPQFLDGQEVITTTDREIAENTGAGAQLTPSVAATDNAPPGDTGDLVYTLSGSDARLFTINDQTGLLSTAAEFDYEDPANRDHRYTVRVTATDPSDASKTITVNIDVTNEDEPPVIDGDDPAPFEENGTGNVARFTARDPESQPIVWSISGNGALDSNNDDRFTVSNGILKFVNAPDFEDPSGLRAFAITLTASAGTGANADATRSFTVEVTNKDEAGSAALTTLQPKEGILLTASLTDPDTGISDHEWEWSRGASRNGPWIHGTGASSTAQGNADGHSYTPDDKDVGNYLRAFVVYLDAEDTTATKTAEVISANVVERADYENAPPMFPDQDPDLAGDQVATTSRSIAENSPAGTVIGAPVTAVDLDERNMQQVLTYSLGVTDDAPSFDIERGTGQIKVGSGTDLNFEVKPSYVVTVIATDPSGLATDGQGNPVRPSPLRVMIMVTDVPEDPSITDGPSNIEINEIIEGLDVLTISRDGVDDDDTVPQEDNGSFELAVYESVDHEDDDDEDDKNVSWMLSGSDADKFEMATTTDENDNNKGQLTLSLKSAPDFEARADSNRDNVYNVRVTVTDSDGVSTHRDVAVTVTNLEEAGTVSLSNRQPEVETPITASLSDIDGGETGITWEWHWADDAQGNPSWSMIRGATSRSYTPVVADSGKFLRATAAYTDNAANPEDRPKDSAPNGISAFAVQAMDDMNETPQFPDQDPDTSGKQSERKVFENTPAGIEVGTDYDIDGDNTPDDVDGDGDGVATEHNPVVATDDDAELTYTLGGTDKDAFTIDWGTGQLMTKAALNFEEKNTYTVTVTATDPALESDTITVTIKVLNVDEEPTTIMRRDLAITGRTSISYPENGTGVVENYSPTGADAGDAVLSLGGTDASAFSLSSSGDLTFRSPPDYEAATDRGSDTCTT